MPVENGVGISNVTATKQMHLRMILRTHINVVQQIFKKRNYPLSTYFYYDVNAGPGVYSNGDIGSPVVFIQEAERAKINYQATFIEINEDSYKSLLSLFGQNPHVKIYFGDNKEIMPQIVPPFNDTTWRYGMLYTDPNGIFNDKSISDFCNRLCFSATDILINCPASAIKRSINSCKCKDDRTLESRLKTINKKYWLVKDPKNSRWQWTHVMLTNWASQPEFKSINMYRHDTNAGGEIFNRLNYTKDELLSMSNYSLFDIPAWSNYNEYLRSEEFGAIRKQVFDRSQHKCEMCKVNIATEPHHTKYANWKNGEIDNPENLMAVCHQCHCIIHGKEN